MGKPFLMGAVAYDPKVVTIWEGFRAWLAGQGFDFDFMLYSHYERQVDDIHSSGCQPLCVAHSPGFASSCITRFVPSASRQYM